MADHPASDPAKPGSKLAAQQALGRPGIGRMIARGVTEAATKLTSAMVPRQPRPAPPPPPPDVDPLAKFKSRGRAAQEAANAEIERVKAAPKEERRAVAKTAIADAMEKATLKDAKPWLKLGISRATYFNRKKAGTL